MPAFRDRWIDAATRGYLQASRPAYHFARGKLRHDPIFLAVLARGLLPRAGHLTDLGCGQGSLIAALLAARDLHARGDWPAQWPEPPIELALHGVDLRPAAVRAAQIAFGSRASVAVGDIRSVGIPPSEAIAILDVLHYIGADEQVSVLERCRAALRPGGTLLLRIGDAGAGLPFLVTKLGDQIVTMMRGTLLPRFHCRPLAEWIEVVRSAGFDVSAEPMSEGTPFANVMLVGSAR